MRHVKHYERERELPGGCAVTSEAMIAGATAAESWDRVQRTVLLGEHHAWTCFDPKDVFKENTNGSGNDCVKQML